MSLGLRLDELAGSGYTRLSVTADCIQWKENRKSLVGVRACSHVFGKSRFTQVTQPS